MPGYANPQNLNRYSYVTNNPLRYTDPTGHRPEDGYVGNQGPLNCKKYSQYCNGGKPKSQKELADMRQPKKTEAQKPWEHNENIKIGYHIGVNSNVPMPQYYGETENPMNVPPFPGGNQNPFTCNGGLAALACLISLGSSIFSPDFGSPSTNSNFFVSFHVNYNESLGITTSDIHWANQYSGQAVLGPVAVNNQVVLQESSYMPTDGTYYPIPESGGVYDGNNPPSITISVLTVMNTPNGSGGVWQNLPPIVLPSLPEAMSGRR